MDPKKTTIQDWLRVQDMLIQKEKQVSELAVKLATGKATEQEMDTLRGQVVDMRVLADAVLNKALEDLHRK